MEPSACSAFMSADIELASEIPVTLQTSELTEPEDQAPRAWGDTARARVMLFSGPSMARQQLLYWQRLPVKREPQFLNLLRI